jgi:phenylpyruvate tautomerase PptA (4-oxalocrotonate tautomerase family)
MPVYNVITTEDFLSDHQRNELATEITRIHVESTGAPELFANVIFTEQAAGRIFSAGKPSRLSVIAATIREGREIEVRQQMLRDLLEMWVRITGAPETAILLAIQEADPRSAMEFGLLFPAAGGEAEWFAENREKLDALGLIPAGM